jgi:hypothetical protein
MGRYFETYWFNVVIIWIMSLLLYPPLYFSHLKKLLNFFGSIELSKNKKKDELKRVDQE